MTMEDEHPPGHDPAAGGLDEDAQFDDFETAGAGGISEMIHNNPIIKVGLVIAIFAAIVGALILFGGKKKAGPVSIVKGLGSKVSEAPGNEVSDVYKKAIQDENQQQVEKALQTHGSALPESIANPQGRVPVTDLQQNAEDPLERWRRIQEERTRRETQQHTNLPQANPNAQAIKDLAGAMSTQMESILNSIKPEHAQKDDMVKFDDIYKKDTGAATGAAGTTGGAGNSGAASQSTQPVEILVPAGTISYAQLITTADSDTKGPVLAEIMGGPLAGDRILGTFQKQNDYLVLSFDTVIIDGIGHSTDAVAIDPSTDTEALATDVDHHYFERIILPAAASFIQGMGSAIANTGTTISQSSSSTIQSSPPLNVKQQVFAGVSTAAQNAGQVLTQDGSQTQVEVTVAAGTPIGLLFVQPVTDQTK